MIDSVSQELCKSDLILFHDLHHKFISQLYPYSSSKTAESFVNSHNKNYEEHGYFTLRKKIWKCIVNNIVVGFTVVSEKRGGSIKFGPTIIVPEFRGQGVGSSFRNLIEKEYEAFGYRKSYSTTNFNNVSAINYILRIGYTIEAHLKDHYEIGKDELVLSKFLKPKKKLLQNSGILGEISSTEKLMYDNLSEYCENIDSTFFSNIRNSLIDSLKKDERLFVNKNRKIFVVNNFAIALTIPKRGGCVKISPLLLSNNKIENEKLIDQVFSFYKKYFHKIYTLIPMSSKETIAFLEGFGFFIEGSILEPYKKGAHLLILSRFLK